MLIINLETVDSKSEKSSLNDNIEGGKVSKREKERTDTSSDRTVRHGKEGGEKGG